MPKHSIVKLLKTKEKILKVDQKDILPWNEQKIRLTARQQIDIFKENNWKPGILYSTKYTSRMKAK